MAATFEHSVGAPAGLFERGFEALTSNILAGFRARAQYRQTVRELSACSDRDLADMGIARFDIARIARGGSLEV